MVLETDTVTECWHDERKTNRDACLFNCTDDSWRSNFLNNTSFQGCIHSVTVNGQSFNIAETTETRLTTPGCPVPVWLDRDWTERFTSTYCFVDEWCIGAFALFNFTYLRQICCMRMVFPQCVYTCLSNEKHKRSRAPGPSWEKHHLTSCPLATVGLGQDNAHCNSVCENREWIGLLFAYIWSLFLLTGLCGLRSFPFIFTKWLKRFISAIGRGTVTTRLTVRVFSLPVNNNSRSAEIFPAASSTPRIYMYLATPEVWFA